MLLDPENTLFVRGATPVLLLADAPVHDALPLLSKPSGHRARGAYHDRGARPSRDEREAWTT